MIKAKKIDHVSLWVRSISEAKSYYENIFGFICTPRECEQTTLIVESDSVHFFLSEGGDENAFISKQHISFEVESLDEIIETLKIKGVTDYEVGEVNFFKYKNYKWCEWKDPSGIRLECVEII